MMDANSITVIDASGKEIEMEVLFTFDNPETGKKYVLYLDPTQEEMNVFASRFDDEGNLFEVETPKEWEMIEEVFNSFVQEREAEHQEGHTCCGGHGHEDGHECCGGHGHDEDHECCCSKE